MNNFEISQKAIKKINNSYLLAENNMAHESLISILINMLKLKEIYAIELTIKTIRETSIVDENVASSISTLERHIGNMKYEVAKWL